ncbi:MAG TPA: DUF4112 domain-containing protein [Woeseiaceae bacterium]|nr:DUF4112 domain-containing protein [Woeseiaceae bacterium]
MDADGDIETRDERLRRLDRLAWLLDNSIPVPGTRFRIGLDGLIGLVPGIGDAVGALLSSYLIAEAARGGASASLILRMALNVAVETIVGFVPVLGDLFDFGFKANARNVRLLRENVVDPSRARTKSRFVVGMAAVVAVGLIAAMLLVAVAVLRWAWNVVTGG